MIYLTRRETFAAAHRLFREGLSDQENFELFGKCSNPNWHGHNYTLEVVVAGDVDPATGFVIDLKKLKEANRADAEKYIGLKEQLVAENQKLENYGDYVVSLFA